MDADLLGLLVKHRRFFFNGSDEGEVDRFASSLSNGEPRNGKRSSTRLNEAIKLVYDRALPLWQFASALSRRLNCGDNYLTPEQAWGMGLIDEVIGTPFVHRQIAPEEREAIQGTLSFADVVSITREEED